MIIVLTVYKQLGVRFILGGYILEGWVDRYRRGGAEKLGLFTNYPNKRL